MYDGGFHGVELCMQDDANAPNDIYAYGSDMWSHKWKLMMNKLLDLGMEVSLTSGTNWATSNVPGLDPDSQQASQVIAMGKTIVSAGETVTALPLSLIHIYTLANKATGLLLFASPVLFHWMGANGAGVLLCAAASLSAAEELILQLRSKRLNLNQKGLLFLNPKGKRWISPNSCGKIKEKK